MSMSDYPERISISPTFRQKREDDFFLVDRKAFPGKGTEYVRADRIEELEAERDDYANKLMQANDTYTEMHLEIELLKAKLAKTVGALGDISDGEPEWPDDPKAELDWCRNRASTTLKELKETRMGEPDWENFAKAVLTDWPTGNLDGSVLFDLSLQYGMIQEVAGGYNSDHHIDTEGFAPEEGDPWYEYTFRGEAGKGLYSITGMNKRIEELEAENADLKAKLTKAVEALGNISKIGVAWSSKHEDQIKEAQGITRTTLKELTGGKDG